MDMKEMNKAILFLVPGAKFSISNDVISWKDERPQPSEKDIKKAISNLPALEAEKNKKNTRNSLLAHSDWTVLPDSPLSEEKAAAWISYRQELRDFPSQNGWVDLEFPAKPE
jgi:hypothetical protein